MQAKGMQDPEIQNILSDPVMRQVRRDELESLSRYLKFWYFCIMNLAK